MSRRHLVPLLLGLVALAAAAPGYVIAHTSAQDGTRAIAAAHAEADDATSTAQLEADAQLLVAASEAIGGDPARPDDAITAALLRVAPPHRTVAVVRTASVASAPVSVVVPPDADALVGHDLGRDDDMRLALELARDAGTVKVVSDYAAAGRRFDVRVQALYGAAAAPLEVAAKRSALAGFVVVFRPIPGPPAAPAGVRAPTGWIVVLAGALALMVAGIARRRESMAERSAADAAARAEELALIARMGPMLQQSLTPSELLPLFVVEVSSEFQLTAASVWLANETNTLTRVFSVGPDALPPELDVGAFATDHDTIAPDGWVHIALERGGRTVGTVRGRAAAGMSERQVRSLAAATNMLAAALGNAQLFENEQELVAQLREIDTMKIAFVGSVSHELRTSTTAIEGFAGLLDNDRLAPDDPRRGEYVQRIRRNARSLGLLVEDLLDFARMEKAGSGPALKRIDLSTVVPEVVDQLSPVVDDHPIAVDVALGVAVNADLSIVERILANLLTNAGKYTPPGTPIEVALVRDADQAVLTVVDHGSGIPEAERERVFRLFYRIEDQAARATRGIGIGLALVRQLVDQIHGSVRIDETPGGGATFRVTIPLLTDPTPTETAQPGTLLTQGG